jgi:hypothetical protein
MPALHLTAWTERDCVGLDGHSIFPEPDPTELNVSNGRIYQSLQLKRSLINQEQLDFSVASDLGTWYGNKDQYSTNSASCDIFLQTLTALNKLTACANVAKFTCHRIWINTGI